jgi:hypothetical protein
LCQAEIPAKQEPSPHRESEERAGEDNSTGSWGDDGSARRLWAQVAKEVQAQKKPAIAALLGGSSAYFDSKNNGLIVELPKNASFAKQTLERAENKELIKAAIEKVQGMSLSFSYRLGTTGESTRSQGVSRTQVQEAANQVSATVDESSFSIQKASETEITPHETVEFEDKEQADTLSFEDMLSASFGTEISVDAISPSEQG